MGFQVIDPFVTTGIDFYKPLPQSHHRRNRILDAPPQPQEVNDTKLAMSIRCFGAACRTRIGR
jgi:hypothetical protein